MHIASLREKDINRLICRKIKSEIVEEDTCRNQEKDIKYSIN
jgi:hypothetical protein